MENTSPSPAETLHIDRLSDFAPICLKFLPGRVVCDISAQGQEAEEDAKRLAASWNALKDIPLKVLEGRPDAVTKSFHVLAACMYAVHELEAGRTDLALNALKEAINAA